MSAAEVERVMRETGMAHMQAVYHLRGRELLRSRLPAPRRAALNT